MKSDIAKETVRSKKTLPLPGTSRRARTLAFTISPNENIVTFSAMSIHISVMVCTHNSFIQDIILPVALFKSIGITLNVSCDMSFS